jgi:hypothetical protein
MSRHLFTVEETFTIRGRGTGLMPGIVPEGGERLRIGDALRLRRPDGSEVEATIDGIEFFGIQTGTYPIVVRLPKLDVPLGTEVWSA